MFYGTMGVNDKGQRGVCLFGTKDRRANVWEYDEILVDDEKRPPMAASGGYDGSRDVLVRGQSVEYKCVQHKQFSEVTVYQAVYRAAA